MTKSKTKAYADKKNRTHSSELKVGDKVLIDVKRGSILADKKLTRYSDENYKITAKKGSMVTASNDWHSITRNSAFIKKASFQGAGENCDPEYELVTYGSKLIDYPVPQISQQPVRTPQIPQAEESIASSRPRRVIRPPARYGYFVQNPAS
ncbi:hypothetical protein BpHYR1_015375 [Brachionus plicatilis]|uniref:Retrovirus-related Pol poly from transposon n=1 Tax=Brachionus plicatilis TaxID=10195 RepID=A0A3M7PEV3_BRAPC|nr:hypothetical protein BpHYR1_015375 [Brachionus plicatilis]